MLLKTSHTVVWCGHTCGQIVPHILSCAGFVFRDSGWSSSWSSQLLDQQCPCSEDRWGCGAPHSTQQHLAQRQGSVHLLVVHFRCDSHIFFQLPHGKLETQLRTLKPAPTVSRSSAVGKAVSLLKILKTAPLILGTMSCTEELGMSKASDSTQYDSAVCAYCL